MMIVQRSLALQPERASSFGERFAGPMESVQTIVDRVEELSP